MNAATRPRHTIPAMCGLTRAANHIPEIAHTIPLTVVPEINRATPKEASPSATTHHASFPIAEGQIKREGRKNTRHAYVRARPSGRAIVKAREKRKRPQKLSHE